MSDPPTAGQTPAVVDDANDVTAQVPPILEEGEVPAPDEPRPITGHLVLGSPTAISHATIGAAGGTIAAGDLTITVPAGTFEGDTTFTVTAAPITGHEFGTLVTPITPLYTVDTGAGTAAAPMTVTMQGTIPGGAVAMAFYYDNDTGTLAPLVPGTQDAGSLTVGATHFSSIFGGLVDLAALPQTADSGFRPGADDWQFPNYGSFAAPGGHCEGQSVSAIWYYDAQRRASGASPLFSLYDNNGASEKTPSLWQDDADGYRFVSSLQAAGIADRFAYLFLRDTMWDSPDGRLTYQAFRAAIAFTGQPQMIRISPDVVSGGHTMIVYRVTNDRLFVADPNYPGRLRTIRFDAATGKLGPYSSGSNAADIAEKGATVYTRIAYVPWQASKSEEMVATRWAEFEGGAAGDAVFPTYNLDALTGKDPAGKEVWTRLVDGYLATDRRLTIRISKLSTGASSAVRLYPGTAATPLGPLAWRQTIDLAEGENPIGIAVFGRVGSAWQYVDFVRVTVNRGDASPSPTPTKPDAGGRWELVSSGKGTEFATTGSISDGRLDDPNVNGYSGSGSWPAPPSVLTPGQAVVIALSTTISPACDAGNADAWGLDGVPARDHRMTLTASWKVPYGPDEAIGTLAADCLHAELSQSFDWVVPERRGDSTTLGLTIRGGVDMNDRHAYEYVYEWRP